MVSAIPGLNVIQDFGQCRGVGLVDRKDDGLADLARGIALRLTQERFAHDAVAVRSENLPFQVLNLEIFLLLVDQRQSSLPLAVPGW